MFFHDLSLTNIEISSNVGSIETNAFLSCYNLTRIIIHKAENPIAGYDTKWGAPDSTEVRWTGGE